MGEGESSVPPPAGAIPTLGGYPDVGMAKSSPASPGVDHLVANGSCQRHVRIYLKDDTYTQSRSLCGDTQMIPAATKSSERAAASASSVLPKVWNDPFQYKE